MGIDINHRWTRINTDKNKKNKALNKFFLLWLSVYSSVVARQLLLHFSITPRPCGHALKSFFLYPCSSAYICG